MADIIELSLFAMANGGAALGRHEKLTIFVPYTIPGEQVQVQLREVQARFAHADLVEVIDSSADRIEAECPHFGPAQCGGCQWQHILYERQLTEKTAVVSDQLQRIGKFENPVVQPTMGSPEIWQYRQHATFRIADTGALGYVAADGEGVAGIETCLILHPTLEALHPQLNLGETAFERVKLQVGSDPEDAMIIFYADEDIAPEVEVDLPVSVNLLLPDNAPVNLIGDTHITYMVAEREFRVTAGCFFQPNLPVTEQLVDEVMRRLELQGDESVLELYSGVGLLTVFLAELVDLVVSVESYPPAVTDAEVNLGELDNVELVEGPVEDVVPDLVGPFDCVVVDPPSSGLSQAIIEELARLEPARIVYISSDVATFARDARQLTEQGFRLVDVQPLDMNPQTYHIQLVATLEL